MKKLASAIVLGNLLLGLMLLPTARAARSWRLHTPRGEVIKLVVTDSALEAIRIYDLAFSEDGDSFSITAAPARSPDTSITVRINFFDGESSVDEDYVDIGPQKTTRQIDCPETLDRMVLDYVGY
ncbi:MAG: hypothetical protein JRJ12_00600 [Deltaproteobacteria bacterium]|nr:hypothetical protein [Deltaproteobacteria bacterium]MBW2071491.1 hypothetical protein [Deltaproteobacteria bacterium]